VGTPGTALKGPVGHGERAAVRVLEATSEDTIANVSDLQLVFFGTSARQTTAARCGFPSPCAAACSPPA
jgi:hypothetical protein